MLSRIMKKAHKIAKEKLEGDYQARLKIALKLAWKEEREEKAMTKEEKYQSWFRRNVDYREQDFEAAKRDRKNMDNMSIEEIKEIITENNYYIKKNSDKGSIITFLNADFEKIQIAERAAGLRIFVQDSVSDEDWMVGLTVDDFVEIRDWARENIEERDLLDIV